MKAQVSILVEKESAASKLKTSMNIWKIGEKRGVYIYVDSEKAEPVFLEQRDEPYFFELNPGNHMIFFKDPKEVDKNMVDGAVKASVMLGGEIVSTLVPGASFVSGITSAIAGGGKKRKSIQDGLATFVLREGELLKFSCRPTRKGVVKVKEIK